MAAGFTLASALFGVYLLFVAPRSEVRVSTPPPRPTPLPLVVQVGGEVQSPGIYEVQATARVDEAVRAAGGPTDQANLDGMNLAARLSDGQRIVVPRVVTDAPPDPAQPRDARTGFATTGNRINLNTASIAELDSLPGIGRVIAGRIVEQRQKALFTSVDQLLELKLVSSATFGRIKDSVTVE